MLASPPVILLALAFLAGPALAAPCQTGVRHVELPPVPTKQEQPVCISPGQATVFSFDATLAPDAVTLEAAEGFTQVEPSASMLKLVPSAKVPLGRELKMTVRFADNAAPSSASFVLVAHAAQAEPLVDVRRLTCPVESHQQELRAKEEETRLLREEVARLRAGQAGPGGLSGPLASGAIGEAGVASKSLMDSLRPSPMNLLRMQGCATYRAAGRIALVVGLENLQGTPAWDAEGAALMREGAKGQGLKVLGVWQGPLAPGSVSRRVVVEAEASPEEAQGTFTLKLWDASGTRTITIGGVSFP